MDDLGLDLPLIPHRGEQFPKADTKLYDALPLVTKHVRHGLRDYHDDFPIDANIEQVFHCEGSRVDVGRMRSRWTCSISRERFATCFFDRVLGESLIALDRYECNVTENE